MKDNKMYTWENRSLPIKNGLKIVSSKDGEIEVTLEKVKLLDTSTHAFLHLYLTIRQGYFQTGLHRYDLKKKSFKMTIPIQVNQANDVELKAHSSIDCYGLSIVNLSLKDQVDFSNAMKKAFLDNPQPVKDILQNSFPDEVRIFTDNSTPKNFLEKEIQKTNGQKQIIRANEDLSLMGWDMVTSTSFATMNERIVRDQNFPKHIEYEASDMFTATKLNLNFSKWQLTTDGGGKNVSLRADIADGSFEIHANQDATYKVNTEQPGFVSLQINLEAFEATTPEDPTGNNDGTGYKLEFDPEETEERDPITILRNEINFVDAPEAIMQYVDFSLKNGLNENKDKVIQIFSFYQLNETSKNPGFEFLKPKVALYGTSVVSDDLNKSAFGIQAMTESTEHPGSQNIDLRLVSASEQRNAVALSKLLYMHHTFDKVKRYSGFAMPEDFSMNDEEYQIYNNKKIQIMTYSTSDDPEQRESDNPWEGCPGFVDKNNWSLQLVNNRLNFKITDLTFEVDGHILHVNYESLSDIKLKSGVDQLGKSYKNVIEVKSVKDPVMTIEVTKEEWLENEQWLLDLLAGIGLGLLGGILGGALGKVFKKYIKGILKESTSSNRLVLHFKDLFEVAGKEIADHSDELTSGLAKQRRNITQYLKSLPQEASQSFVNNVIKSPSTLPLALWKQLATNSASIILGSIGGAVGETVGQHMSDFIDNQFNDKFSLTPPLDPMPEEIVNTLIWPEQSEFSLQTAKLLGSVYLMGGDFNS
ncbi:TULIP family P47-like protein [Furfurilactobacillus entadae]|uniref:TULIP family P47-like protein n=1 Tax=Furfurilactobacillus entadae TaxID=2922307 RepID=UPI0035E7303A